MTQVAPINVGRTLFLSLWSPQLVPIVPHCPHYGGWLRWLNESSTERSTGQTCRKQVTDCGSRRLLSLNMHSERQKGWDYWRNSVMVCGTGYAARGTRHSKADGEEKLPGIIHTQLWLEHCAKELLTASLFVCIGQFAVMLLLVRSCICGQSCRAGEVVL